MLSRGVYHKRSELNTNGRKKRTIWGILTHFVIKPCLHDVCLYREIVFSKRLLNRIPFLYVGTRRSVLRPSKSTGQPTKRKIPITRTVYFFVGFFQTSHLYIDTSLIEICPYPNRKSYLFDLSRAGCYAIYTLIIRNT